MNMKKFNIGDIVYTMSENNNWKISVGRVSNVPPVGESTQIYYVQYENKERPHARYLSNMFGSLEEAESTRKEQIQYKILQLEDVNNDIISEINSLQDSYRKNSKLINTLQNLITNEHNNEKI